MHMGVFLLIGFKNKQKQNKNKNKTKQKKKTTYCNTTLS